MLAEHQNILRVFDFQWVHYFPKPLAPFADNYIK
jgi:hypothetical protein